MRSVDFNQLPSDLYHNVFRHLAVADVVSSSRVNKVWHEESSSSLLWRDLCVRDHHINVKEYHHVRDWAAEYRSLLLQFDPEWICPGQSQTPYSVFDYNSTDRSIEKVKDATWMAISRSKKEYVKGKHYAKFRVDSLPSELPASYLDIGIADSRYTWTQCWLRYDGSVAAAMDADLKVGSTVEIRFDARTRNYQIHVNHSLKSRGVLGRMDTYSHSGIFFCIAARALGIKVSVVDYQPQWPEDHLVQRIMRPKSMMFASAAASSGIQASPLIEEPQDQLIRQLPMDIMGHVFRFLSTECVIACTQVCKAWHQEASSDFLWRQLCIRDFGLLTMEAAEREDEHRDWRAFHKSSVFCFDREYICPDQPQLFTYSNYGHTVRKVSENDWMAIARNTKALESGKHFAWYHVDALPSTTSQTYLDIGIADAEFSFKQCWLRYDPVVCGVQDKAMTVGSDVEIWFDAITREYRICVDGVEKLAGTLARPRPQVLSGAYFCVAMRNNGIQCTVKDYRNYWPMESVAMLKKREMKQRKRRGKKCIVM